MYTKIIIKFYLRKAIKIRRANILAKVLGQNLVTDKPDNLAVHVLSTSKGK